jgi:hypothetical protein
MSIFILLIFLIFSQISDVKWKMLEMSCGLKIVNPNKSAYKSFFTCTRAE